MYHNVGNRIAPFRFWCQKVIPLVYDDSLSYYELLCKVVAHLNEIGEATNILIDSFEQLKDWVEHYFDSTDFQEMVNNKLDEMADDGTLESMLNGKVFSDLQYLIPQDDERELYKDMVRETLVSYLNIARGSNIFASGSPDTEGVPVCYDYGMGEGYYGLYGIGEFVTNREYTVDGVDCKAVVLDCTTFASLILKGIPYIHSPYYKTFNTGYTYDEIYESGLEDMTETTRPFTIDSMTEPTSYRMAFIMNQSGCHLKTLTSKTLNETIFDDVVFDTMETGDILFFGNSKDSTRYKGIYHCSIFVKTLEELNGLTHKTFKPIENGDDKYGYVVHVVSDKSGGVEYRNVLCIECLNNRVTQPLGSDVSWRNIYVCKPFSNANNDSRALAYTMLIKRESDFTKWLTPTRETNVMVFDHTLGNLQATGLGSRGVSMGIVKIPGMEDVPDSNFNLDNYKFNGHFRPYTATHYQKLTGLPPNESPTSYIDLFCFDFALNGSNVGTQLLIIRAPSQMRMYTRTCVNNVSFTPWSFIGNPMQNGTTEAIIVPANGSATQDIVFNRNFPNAPNIQLTLQGSYSQDMNARFVTVSSKSSTGFTIKYYNPTDSDTTMRCMWRAEMTTPVYES